MRSVRYLLIVLLAIAPVAQGVLLALALFSNSPFTLVSVGVFPRDLGVVYYIQVLGLAILLIFQVGLAFAIYLGEAWARLFMLGSLVLGFVGTIFNLLEDPGLSPVLAASYCLLLGFVLAHPTVKSFLDSQSAKRANKAPARVVDPISR
ncbi:MAG: hypothetical protein V4773_14345 [Verrucomicrobiota bacterium]